jgi:hypothetical protein
MPGPRDAVTLVQRAGDALEEVLAAGPRLAALLTEAERIVREIDRLLAEVDGLLQRVEATRLEAQRVVRLTDNTRARADRLVAALEPSIGPLERLHPTLERLAETTDPAEVDALVALIDTLPVLAGQVEGDVIPVMRSLSSVAPDVHSLLDLTREPNAMLAKLPGMGRIKKRVDEQQSADEATGP